MLRIDKQQGGDGIIVRFPARTWEKAHRVVESLRSAPPEGYRMRGSSVTPKSRSGRRCNMKLTFEYVDDRHPVFTLPEAHDWFLSFAEEAKVDDTQG